LSLFSDITSWVYPFGFAFAAKHDDFDIKAFDQSIAVDSMLLP
jgi:hypothetical protein